MSYKSSASNSDSGFLQLNKLYSWVFDSKQSEVNGSGSYQISNISSENTIDVDFRQFNDGFGNHRMSNRSSERFNPDSEKPNKQFFWDDDSKQSAVGFRGYQISDIFSGDIFDWAYKKLNDLFSWVGGSGGHHCCCHSKCHVRANRTLRETRDVPLRKNPEPFKSCSLSKPCLENDDGKKRNGFSLSNGKLFDDVNEINVMLRQLTTAPIEPEGKEEDLYLSCRKDAIEMIRAAAQHLEAAKNAFLKGDHISAKKLSQKAREERRTAAKLHEEAAREILRINNKNNGIMKLDLHHLHVSEAIEAVKERLHMIETRAGLASLEAQTAGNLKLQRLQVITGRGKHSTRAPKLPAAVRSFLKENGYHIDVSRPGVIIVQPKFRSI